MSIAYPPLRCFAQTEAGKSVEFVRYTYIDLKRREFYVVFARVHDNATRIFKNDMAPSKMSTPLYIDKECKKFANLSIPRVMLLASLPQRSTSAPS